MTNWSVEIQSSTGMCPQTALSSLFLWYIVLLFVACISVMDKILCPTIFQCTANWDITFYLWMNRILTGSCIMKSSTNLVLGNNTLSVDHK